MVLNFFKYAITLVFFMLAANSNALAQSAYGKYCDPDEIVLLKKIFSDSEIRLHCSGHSGNDLAIAGTKYNWEVCHKIENRCQPSKACVATRAEAEELMRIGGHERTWSLTGTRLSICGSSGNTSSSAVTKYHWEVCHKTENRCQPSNACVATKAEAEELMRIGGHKSTWTLTGKKRGTC